MKPPNLELLYGYVARVSVEALADQYSDMISDRVQRSTQGYIKDRLEKAVGPGTSYS